ncbi:hypothetical protein CTAYLR_002999 [Chrysophaeum taylorii]|uniref:Uncharacterized protein n=1 Tax=Chrysophaeum taylorii TaxID=2483200 RepID=A0AAD7U605_9STRA|nr:hypothetical protein CTAYLR_002999 [Chrysophaeum taylorii]
MMKKFVAVVGCGVISWAFVGTTTTTTGWRSSSIRLSGRGSPPEFDDEGEKKFPTIQELMKATEDKLRRRQQGFEEPNEYLERLEALAGRKDEEQEETFVVAVVLGKALASGRLSVEHAARVCALVRALRDDTIRPSLVVFSSSASSSRRTGTNLDDAQAACVYFQHAHETVVERPFPWTRLVVSNTPLTTKEAMRRLLATAVVPKLPTEAFPLRVDVFASDYQLRRLDKVWRVTPRLSLFAPLSDRSKRAPRGQSRALETTWTLHPVGYPPRLLANETNAAGAFLAKANVVVDSLVPLLINLHAVVNKEEFLARDYYDDLVDARNRLADALALVDSPMRPAALKLATMATLGPKQLAAHFNNADAPPLIDESLERVVRWLGDLERLLRPAAKRTDSLSSEDWRAALKLLQKALREAKAALDPDLPLPADAWGCLVDIPAPYHANVVDNVESFANRNADGDVLPLLAPWQHHTNNNNNNNHVVVAAAFQKKANDVESKAWERPTQKLGDSW